MRWVTLSSRQWQRTWGLGKTEKLAQSTWLLDTEPKFKSTSPQCSQAPKCLLLKLYYSQHHRLLKKANICKWASVRFHQWWKHNMRCLQRKKKKKKAVDIPCFVPTPRVSQGWQPSEQSWSKNQNKNTKPRSRLISTSEIGMEEHLGPPGWPRAAHPGNVSQRHELKRTTKLCPPRVWPAGEKQPYAHAPVPLMSPSAIREWFIESDGQF